MDTTFTKINDLNSHEINVIKNLESVSSKISPDRPQTTKESNLSSNVKNLDLNRNFNTFPLVQAHRLKNPKNVTIGHLNVNSLRNKFMTVEELIHGRLTLV